MTTRSTASPPADLTLPTDPTALLRLSRLVCPRLPSSRLASPRLASPTSLALPRSTSLADCLPPYLPPARTQHPSRRPRRRPPRTPPPPRHWPWRTCGRMYVRACVRQTRDRGERGARGVSCKYPAGASNCKYLASQRGSRGASRGHFARVIRVRVRINPCPMSPCQL